MSLRRRFLAAAVLALAALPVMAGCASSTEQDETATEDSAVTRAKCGAATYDAALVHYKAAVAKAKQRKGGDACGGDAGEATVADIAAEAQQAVTTCGAFRDVIKTSPWAGDVRDQLKGTLSYPVLLGSLDTTTWNGLGEALAAGVKMHGPAPGVYGNTGLLTFEANGRGSMGILQISDKDGSAYWGKTDMRWVVGVRAGAAVITVIAEYENDTEKTFTYLLKKAEPFFGAPDFVLELQADADAPGALQKFDTYPSECEA